MKNAIIITLGLATVMTMASCRAVQNTEATQDDILVTTRTAATESAEETEAPEITTTTSAYDARNYEKTFRKIDITDAVNSTFTLEGDKYNFKIPMVTISGVNTDAANKTIRNEIEQEFHKDAEYAFDSEYNYFVGDKTVSIVVSNMDLLGGEFVCEKVYNIDINTGKLIPASEVIRMAGMTDDEFFNKVKTLYTKYDNKQIKQTTDKFEKKYVKENLKRISYKYIQPYFGDNGKLSFIGNVHCVGGAGVDYAKFTVA